jgi:glyoxylase-like metal-dependent hydrolase (beta-lactamase superfamily II)
MGREAHPAWLGAGNAGPFTLDGTRTFRVGRGDAVLIDPGPDVDAHVRALLDWVADADHVTVLLTHGHRDHAGAAPAVAAALGAEVVGPAGVGEVTRTVEGGDVVVTDEGDLTAVHTPGHTPEHLCYHWPARDALFAGDLLLGEGDTTWVADYPGCVADYLASLARVRTLAPRIIYPAHGPPLEDVAAALDRFEAHRRARICRVEEALRTRPAATARDLLAAVYGPDLPPRMEGAALRSLEALIEHVRDDRVR